MDKHNIKKEYTNGELTIVWQSGKCIHSGNCVKNNPPVFQPKEHPWIKPEASSTDAIMQAINQCPSGALSYYWNSPKVYDNLVDAIKGLKEQGYAEDFNLQQNCLSCRDGAFTLFHDEFEIDQSFRFDGDTNPEEESIIYAISSKKYNLKGILVNGYGTSSAPITNEMLEKLDHK
jgi:uncharacterized Fe-S cluster protein YjdI